MAHKITAKYSPPQPHESEVLNLLSALRRTHQAYIQSETGLRSRLTKRVVNFRKRVKSYFEKKLESEKEKLSLASLLQTEKRYAQAIKDAEQDSLQVAIILAKSIIGEAVESKTSNLGSRLKPLLKRLPSNRTIRIAVHEDEVASLHEYLTKHSPEYSINLLTDSRVSLGNARIETAGGTIEVSWKAHFEELVALLQLHQSSSENIQIQNELHGSQNLDA